MMKARTFFLLLLAGLLLFPFHALAQGLRAGAAKVSVTPSKDCFPVSDFHGGTYTAVHDSLFARAIYLEQDGKGCLLVGVDYVDLPESLAGDVCRATGLPEEAVMLFASHSHSMITTDKSVEIMRSGIVGAARKAMAAPIPVQLSFGRDETSVAINNGEVEGLPGHNPAGYTDRTLDVLRITGESGPVAEIVNFASHAEVMFRSMIRPGEYEVSADLPGKVSTLLESRADGAPVVLSTCGVEGNQLPRLASWRATNNLGAIDLGADGYTILEVLGQTVADDVLSCSLAPVSGVLSFGKGSVSVPGRRIRKDRQTGEVSIEHTADVAIPIGYLRIGDSFALEAIGGDVAAEIGTRIREAAPVAGKTMLVTMMAGSTGYILNDEAYEKAIHGVMGSRIAPGYAEKALTDGFLALAGPMVPFRCEYSFQRIVVGGREGTQGMLFTPSVKTAKASIGIVAMHSDQNYMDFIANGELASRGYTVLALDAPADQIQSHKWLAEKAGVEYLRSLEGIRKVVLLGHSGGATTTSAYQLVAENGREVLAYKLYNDYPENLSLPAADGVMFLDANYGNGVMTLLSLDPNIVDAGTKARLKAKLDLADEKVGYRKDGTTRYDKVFIKKYVDAQAARLCRLMDLASRRLDAVRKGKAQYADDEPFTVPVATQVKFNNRLVPQDVSLLSHTAGEWPLIHADGSVTTEQVNCLRAPLAWRSSPSRLFSAAQTTVRGFLSAYALSTDKDLMIYEDRIEGINWTSNINNPVGNATGIHVPVLCVGMTGSYEYLAAEWIYNACPSADKTCAFVEGASHMFTPDRDAEKYQNRSFGDTVKALFDYVDTWLSTPGRFMD